MSKLSFITFCIEYYSQHINRPGNEVYARFEKEGLLDLLDSDYEDLHGEIIRNEVGRDFGFAFYTTDIQEQAERWAVRKAKIEGRRFQKNVSPIVNVYEWKMDKKLVSFSGL